MGGRVGCVARAKIVTDAEEQGNGNVKDVTRERRSSVSARLHPGKLHSLELTGLLPDGRWLCDAETTFYTPCQVKVKHLTAACVGCEGHTRRVTLEFSGDTDAITSVEWGLMPAGVDHGHDDESEDDSDAQGGYTAPELPSVTSSKTATTAGGRTASSSAAAADKTAPIIPWTKLSPEDVAAGEFVVSHAATREVAIWLKVGWSLPV